MGTVYYPQQIQSNTQVESMYAITIYTYPLRDYSPKGDRVHRYHIVRYSNNYRIYIIPPAPSFPLRVWPSGFALDSFRCLAGRLPFQSSLGKISAPSVGRCQEKPFLGKKPCLGSFVPGEPIVGWLLFSFRLGEISASLVGRCQEKPFLGEKPFLSSFASGKPVVLGKTCLLFGAHRGRSPFLAIYSLPVFGRFLRLQSVVVRKNPSWEKTFSWQLCFRKTHLVLGKTQCWQFRNI